MKKLNILFVISMIFFFFFIGFNSYANAQTTAPKLNLPAGWLATSEMIKLYTGYDGESAASFPNKITHGLLEGFVVNIGGSSVVEGGENLFSKAGLPEYMDRGLIGIVDDGVVAMMNNHPRIDIVAHLSEEWIPGYSSTGSVYASGYDDLIKTGIGDFWSVTRNIAYLVFVLVMILIGFMIMFRNKIGGQMMVTLGNALPRIVICLVLVTFSFAIIGLIIDFCGVLMRVVDNALGTGTHIHKPLELLMGLLGISNAMSMAGLALPTVAMSIVGAVIAGPAAPVGALVGGILGFILTLVVLGFVIVGAVKLWITLLKAYLAILLNVVIAPISITLGALPGNDAAIINLFKSVLRNGLVFPVAYAIVNLPYILEPKQVSIGFPETLVMDSTGSVGIGGLMIAVAKIVAIYVAAQTPALLQAAIPATASKSGADAAAAIKAGFSKVPFIGGAFK